MPEGGAVEFEAVSNESLVELPVARAVGLHGSPEQYEEGPGVNPALA